VTVADKVPLFEPLRHDAGGCLCTLFLNTVGKRDIRTLENLSNAPIGPMAWDKAIVARTLLQARLATGLTPILRHKMKKREQFILKDLLDAEVTESKPACIWADSYEYGLDVNNQWATVWALLPFMSSPRIRRTVQRELDLTLRLFLRAQDAAAIDEHQLLPKTISKSGKGIGGHVFGTAMALVAWRTLELNSPNNSGESKAEANAYARKTFNRLLSMDQNILELPSHQNSNEPLALEGYFAWAGLCLAAASVGIRILATDSQKLLALVSEITSVGNRASSNQLEKVCSKAIRAKGVLDAQTADPVARACNPVTRN